MFENFFFLFFFLVKSLYLSWCNLTATMPSEELGFGTFLFLVILQLSELFCRTLVLFLRTVERVFFGVG